MPFKKENAALKEKAAAAALVMSSKDVKEARCSLHR